MKNNIFSLIILLVFLISCKEKRNNKSVLPNESINKNDSLRMELRRSLDYFADSLLNGNRALMKSFILKYQPDTCGIILYSDSSLKSAFEGIKRLTDINGDKIDDSVFVIPPLNYCDEGQSYYFTDTSLPRLFSNSYCCHPDNLFVVDDIDEDGIKEIGVFNSSCASRYKMLKIYSLKTNNWQEISTSTFDILTKDPTTVKFETLVKKVSKYKFKVCAFNEGKTEWIEQTMQ